MPGRANAAKLWPALPRKRRRTAPGGRPALPWRCAMRPAIRAPTVRWWLPMSYTPAKGLERAQDFFVERLDAGAVVPLDGAPPGRVRPAEGIGENERKVEHLCPRHLRAVHTLEQVHPADDLVEALV